MNAKEFYLLLSSIALKTLLLSPLQNIEHTAEGFFLFFFSTSRFGQGFFSLRYLLWFYQCLEFEKKAHFEIHFYYRPSFLHVHNHHRKTLKLFTVTLNGLSSFLLPCNVLLTHLGKT